MRPGPTTLDLLETGEVQLVGRVADASNLAYLARVSAGKRSLLAVYKPVHGERPLWDFPDGTLAAREAAAYHLSAAGGWDVVPETVLRVGPDGEGSLQRWVGDPYAVPDLVVDVVPPRAVPQGWLPVLHGQGARGEPVVVVHEDSPQLRSVAVFDAVINNSDRKGTHLVREGDAIRGFDHGVSLHEDDKLRTVLWGFAGDPLPEPEVARLGLVHELLADRTSALSTALAQLLTTAEVAALQARVRRLLDHPAYPLPGEGWPSVPWPPL